MKILIQNGQVINPATQMNEIADVLVENGLICRIDKKIKGEADRVIDARGCYIMPGFIDLHVHLRDPGFEHKETIETGCHAAARGGFTTILAMPNTKPVVDNPDVVNYVHNKAKMVGVVNVLQVGAVTQGQKGEQLSDIRGMAEAGIPAISEDGRSVMDAELYRRAMEQAAELGLVVLAHCEDHNLVKGGVMNADANARELGLEGITNSVEDVIIARDIMLSHGVGVKLHLCHCSTKDSVKMVKYAKQENFQVTAEVCPHHFTLTSDDIHKTKKTIDVEKKVEIDADADTNFKMNPPLRTKEDVQALKEGLRDNIMDVIATDHAPHTFDEKNTTMKKAPFGIVGLETAASITYTELVEQGYLTPMQMAEKLSYNPARVIGLDKGDIQPGKVADLVIFDPRQEYRIDKNSFVSKSSNTPFHGKLVKGKVVATLVGGRFVYESKKQKQKA
ncbi:MAG: dihydroorotase [Roseburia sp.]